MASNGVTWMNLPETDSEDELPPGWEERATFDGRVYYTDHATQTTQWVHPKTGKEKVVSKRSLPFGWKQVISEEGSVTYVDTINNRTTFTDPRLAFAVERGAVAVADSDDTAAAGNGRCTFRQRFDSSSTAAQVLHGVDMTGKVAVVTGANSGAGFATCEALARQGCRVVLACRDPKRAEDAISRIKSSLSDVRSVLDVDLAFLPCDLSSLEAVRRFALDFLSRYDRLDLLVLNAGVGMGAFRLTDDGYESTFQTNHLGHFYLTSLLCDILVESQPSRVVVVSSEAHRMSYLNKENLTELRLSPTTPSQYWSCAQYNDTKLCNVAFAAWLQRHFVRRDCPDVLCFSLHPGNVFTSNFQKSWWLLRLIYLVARPFTKSLAQAAATTCFAASAPELTRLGGCYLNNCCVTVPSKAALDIEFQEKLAEISNSMIRAKMGAGSCLSFS